MALSELMNLSNASHKQGLSEERIKAQLFYLRHLIAFFREYPDIFIDFIKGENCTFEFYTYQRIFLRVVMRHRYVYATFPRASMGANNSPLIEGAFGQTSLIVGILNS